MDRQKDYFDHILEDIDPVIKLGEEQRRAVISGAVRARLKKLNIF